MKKFRLSQSVDYVEGHLRYGHKELVIEAETLAEAETIASTIDMSAGTLVVDDYRVNDYGEPSGEIYIREIPEVVQVDTRETYYGVADLKTGRLVHTGRGFTPAVYDNLSSARRTASRFNGTKPKKYDVVEIFIDNVVETIK